MMHCRNIYVVLLCGFLAACTLTACTDHNTNYVAFGDDPEPSPPTSIEEVVAAIEESYVARDLERFLSLPDEDMVFTYVDRDSNGVPVERSWGFSEEATIHQNMFDNTDHPNHPSNIRLTLAIKSSEALPDSGEGWWRCTCSVDLKVDINWTTYWANQNSRFDIGPVAPAESALEIKVWEDTWEEAPLREASFGSSLHEPTGWADIKSMFFD
jgi:hypothetical protein